MEKSMGIPPYGIAKGDGLVGGDYDWDLVEGFGGISGDAIGVSFGVVDMP